tara:strand:+ start:64 stop:405 length:342 start_codon:yes stop_codon:yes gene_type:complete
MGRNWEKLNVRAAAGSATGSIVKVCAVDASNASTIDNWVAGNFNSLTYGAESTASISGDVAAHTGSQNDVHQIGTQDIDIPAGTCVDGPFIAIGTNAEPTIIYYNGHLTSIDD